MTKEQIDNLFTYHKPFGNQPERYEAIRAKARELAHVINDSAPESREKSIALTQLQLSVMLANSAIAVNEKEAPAEAPAAAEVTADTPTTETAPAAPETAPANDAAASDTASAG